MTYDGHQSNLFQGQRKHFAAPKTHFAQDIILSADISIFTTIIEMVQFVGKSNHVHEENAMITSR